MLMAGVRPRYPHLQLSELARHVREPQRTRLLVLLDEASEWIPFPMEIEAEALHVCGEREMALSGRSMAVED